MRIQSVSLPQELEREATQLQKENKMSRSELYRAALRAFIAQERRFKEINVFGTKQAKKMGLETEEEVMRARRLRREEQDDNILACALEAHADWLVTGDKLIQALMHFRGIEILSPRDALGRLV